MKGIQKRIIFCASVVLLFIMMSLSISAAEAPTLRLVSQDKVTGNIIISVAGEEGTLVKLYRKTGEDVTVVNSITTNGNAQEFMLSFKDLPCGEAAETYIYAETSDGNRSGALTVSAHGPHTAGGWTTTKATGCTEDGTAAKKCTVCGEVLETKTMAATGHNWGEPTWTWASDYSSCTAIITCKKDSKHTNVSTIKNITVTKTVNATCISAGSKTYSASFGFNGQTYTTSKTVTVPKTAHNLSDWSVSVAPTCTKTGTRVKKCTACRDIITSESIPALGHNYNITYTWSADNTTCTAKAVCSRDKTHVQSETVKGLDKIVKQASCIAAGKLTRTATFTNSLFKAQTKTASITGSHVDANKDEVCDVCKMKLNTVITTAVATTTSRNLFDKLFNNDDKTTTATTETANTTEAPTEIVTSYKFEEDSSESKAQEVVTGEESNQKTPPTKIIVVLVVVVIVSAIGAVACIIMLRKDKKELEKESKKKINKN